MTGRAPARGPRGVSYPAVGMWGAFPPPAAGQQPALRTLFAELDAGRTDSPAVRRWLDDGAPFAFLLRAVALRRAGRRDAAAADVARAVELAPRSVLVLTLAARMRFALREYDAAFADLAAAAALPTSAAAASALDWSFELARRLGRYREALDTAAGALALDAGAADRNLARLDQIADLLQVNANYSAALHYTQAALALDPNSVRLHMRAAALHCRRGDPDGTRRAIAAATTLAPRDGGTVAVRLEGARQLIELGAFADARGQLRRVLDEEPGSDAALALLGVLALWSGQLAEAERCADAVIAAGGAPGWRLRGALRVLADDHAAALADLDEALRRDPRDYEAHVWRGEALYRLGRPDDAFAALNRGGEMVEEYADYLAPQMLRLLAQAARGTYPGLPEQGVPAALEEIFPGRRQATDERDLGAMRAFLEDALRAMAGNRSVTATFVSRDAAGEPKLVPLRVRRSPRGPSKLALWLLTSEGREAAERALEAVHREYPDSPEPHCYHGELYLYVGDYVAARRQFDQALALYDRTRWAFIGLGAVELLEGHPERTLPLLERSVELSRGAGPTLYVYRGEAQRRLGNFDAAIADLDYATQLNPTRVSAWVNLALARDETGEQDALAAGLRHLRRIAPGLVHDAARAAGVVISAVEGDALSPDRDPARALFETMLRMMRGNRSSTCVTYFSNDGHLRVVPPVPSIDAQLEARELGLVRALLARSLGITRQ